MLWLCLVNLKLVQVSFVSIACLEDWSLEIPGKARDDAIAAAVQIQEY